MYHDGLEELADTPWTNIYLCFMHFWVGYIKINELLLSLKISPFLYANCSVRAVPLQSV